MRTIVVACLALSAGSLGFVHDARAADPYWQSHHEVQWQDRKTFKEPEFQKPEWLRSGALASPPGPLFARGNLFTACTNGTHNNRDDTNDGDAGRCRHAHRAPQFLRRPARAR
jgi:hypothetical protein